MIELPPRFLEFINQDFPFESEALAKSLLEQPKTSIRFNELKINKALNLPDFKEKVPWSKRGYYVEKRTPHQFITDPLWHAGIYYVQEASSMFLEYVLQQLQFEEIGHLSALDLCAAPGGKSIILSDFVGEHGVVVSNELVPARRLVLKENLIRWGSGNLTVTGNDLDKFQKGSLDFDLVLVDAPCSGEGMFRKSEDALKMWSEQNVQSCAVRQKSILQQALNCVKPGGFLIYSTCTFNKMENDQNVEVLINESDFECVDIKIPNDWGIEKSKLGLRFFPHLVKGEGFFISVLRKKNGKKLASEKPLKAKRTNVSVPECVLKPEGFILFEVESRMFVSNTKLYNVQKKLKQHKFNILYSGTYVGEYKGKDFIPSHELSLSRFNNIHNGLNVSMEEALKFLRKEQLEFNADAPKGFAVVKYDGCPLGIVKVLNNRMNNYLPISWRIRNY